MTAPWVEAHCTINKHRARRRLVIGIGLWVWGFVNICNSWLDVQAQVDPSYAWWCLVALFNYIVLMRTGDRMATRAHKTMAALNRLMANTYTPPDNVVAFPCRHAN